MSASTPPDLGLWQPPPAWPPYAPVSTRRRLLLPIAVIGSIAVLLTLFTVLEHAQPARRALPRTAAEALAWEGHHVTVETGSTPEGATYRFEMSRSKDGDLCDFVMVTAAPGDRAGGGGGGCGSGNAIGLEYGSNGAVHGLTSARIASVEVITGSGRIVVPTKAVPAGFGKHRYYVAFFAPGVVPTRLIGRDANGSIVARQEVGGPGRP